jgi:hypothetical protein
LFDKRANQLNYEKIIKMRLFFVVIFRILLLTVVFGTGSLSAKKTIRESEIDLSSQIKIDGELDESHWQNALRFDQFKVTQPLSFEMPPNKTQVLVTSDQKGLYIGFINHQTKNESVSSHSLKDAQINTDYNQVIVDFDAQGVRAYGFKVSRTGAMQDSVWTDENRESSDWNANWQSSVSIEEDEGLWISEIFIPWSVAVMTSGDTDKRQVKLYFSRRHQGKNQSFSYPAISSSQKTFMSNFEQHQLTFEAASSFDIFPYLVYNQDLENASSKGRSGADIFWKPTASQQVNLTINPDFGQVESDELVVNFSAIETFTSEKRPFFRENHDLFDLQGPETLRLVHTPRIGSAAAQAEVDTATDIAGAARYTLIGDSFDIGFLSAFENDDKHQQGNDFFATRLLFKHQEFQLGILHTLTDKPSLDKKSNVTALDFQIEPIDELRFSGQLIKSRIEQITLPELSSGSIKGNAWWLTTEWEPNDQVSHALTWLDYDDKFNVSDFGFVSRVNRKQLEYEGSYQWADIDFELFNANVRDIETSWSFQNKDNTQHHDLPLEIEVGVALTFDSTQAIEFQYEQRTSGIDDLLTRGNNPVQLPRAFKYSFAYISPQNSAFTFQIDFAKGEDFLQGRLREVEFSPSYQLNESSDISLEIEWVRNDSWLIWDEANTLEEFERDELSIALNFNAVIYEKHELRLKLEAVALEAIALNEYEANSQGNLVLESEPPDSFTLSEFGAQLRYRYALSGLSELFIVYSRGGEFEQESLGFNRASLINRAINRDDSENLMFKLKLHF